jgi:hypothetical protein
MKLFASLLVSLAFVFALLQFPSNQPIGEENKQPSAEPFRAAEVGETLKRACGDCHSNQTNWPWYSHISPVSSWIRNHVRLGQSKLNFSDWETYPAEKRHREQESICGVISMDRMPPASYMLMHPQARLSPQEKKMICSWTNSELERGQ